MLEWLAEFLDVAKPYWPFLVQCLVFWFVGNNLKKRVFIKAKAARSKFYGFMRSTMWAHPMIAGAVWGALWPWMPAIEWITTRGGAITQGILAGVVSVVGFVLLEFIAEKRGWGPVLRMLREVGRPTSHPPKPRESPPN